jgi:biopolymer transport protein ExbD
MRKRRPIDRPEMPIAPMIDCVFLMLVYFMTTSSLEKSEADLPCPFGQAGVPADPLPAIDEQQLTLTAQGRVHWNGSEFAMTGAGADRAALAGRLRGFRMTCTEAGSTPSLRILPDADAPHQALVSLLDAVSEAEIHTLHFP